MNDLGTNLTRDVKHQYTENCKTILIENKEDLKELYDIHVSEPHCYNVKLCKLSYSFSAIYSKWQEVFEKKLTRKEIKLSLYKKDSFIFIWKGTGPRIAKTVLRKQLSLQLNTT